MIYTVGGIKGGSGKTTVATNLTIMLSLMGRKVLLVDADDQGSATDFTAARNEAMDDKAGYTAIRLFEDAVRREVLNFADTFDDIVIDTGGRDTKNQRSAMVVSDVYLVPFVPGSYDIWTIDQVEQLIGEIRAVNPDLRAYVFVNKGDHEGHYNEQASEVLRESEELAFLPESLGNFKVYRHSTALGQSIVEYKPRHTKAITELCTLFDRVVEGLEKTSSVTLGST